MIRRGNVLVMQSGGSTAVLNRSLIGVVRECLEHDDFGDLYGAIHGLDGVLSGRLVDLARPTGAQWARIARTPGAALGSSRKKLNPEDVPAVLRLVSERSVRFCFIIGGNDSAETGLRMGKEAQAAGVPLSVVNVPKTIDNDLARTDHSPGYGSAARFVALATMGAGRDAETMGDAAPVTVMEVMGRDAGWLAAAATLARREERDAPHVVCVPEAPVDEGRFLDLLDDAYRRFGYAVAVVAENVRGADSVLGGDAEPLYVDDFGHPYFEGAGRYLAALAGGHLGRRVRYEKPGTVQRSMWATVSGVDAREAEMAGRAAVRAAIQGATGQMVTLVRSPGQDYSCTTGLAPLGEIAGVVKRMPDDFLDPEALSVTEEFRRYARPLIGPSLPLFGRIE